MYPSGVRTSEQEASWICLLCFSAFRWKGEAISQLAWVCHPCHQFLLKPGFINISGTQGGVKMAQGGPYL